MVGKLRRTIGRGTAAAVLAVAAAAAPRLSAGPPGSPSDAAPAARALWWDRTPPRRDEACGLAIRSDLPPLRQAEIVDELLRFERRLDTFLPPGRPGFGERTLWLFESRRCFEETLRVRCGVRGEGRIAAVLPERGGGGLALCDASPSMTAVLAALRREAAVQLLEYRYGQGLPPAIVEGLAAWSAASVLPGGEWSPGFLSREVVETASAAVAESRTIGPERLLRLAPAAWRMNEAGPAARLQASEAWLLVAFLLETPGFRDRLALLLEGARRGHETAVAIEAAFGDLPQGQLDELWREWMRSVKVSPLAAAIAEAEALCEARLRLEASGRPFESFGALRDPAASRDGSGDPDAAASRAWRPVREIANLPEGLVERWSAAVPGARRRLEVRWSQPAPGSLRHEIVVLRAGSSPPPRGGARVR